MQKDSLPIMRLIVVFLFFFAATSCSVLKSKKLKAYVEKSSCSQETGMRYQEVSHAKSIHEMDLDTMLTKRFTATSLNAAHAIGVLEWLDAYIKAVKISERDKTEDNRIKVIELLQKINQRINLSSLEISAMSSELDCEEERITQLADYMKAKEGEAESRLTVTAIVVGATGALFSGITLNGGGGKASDYVAIASGITEASLGLLILFNQRKVKFFHPRNALKEIWDGKDSSRIFPPSVWYYFNYYNPAQPANKPLREQIIDRWMSFKQIEGAKSKRKDKLINLYFGEGGEYTTDQLFNRAKMYDQVESYVKLIKQDLMLLTRELEAIN